MYDDAQQEAQRVDQDVPLATFDLLARVVARRIERRPLFERPSRSGSRSPLRSGSLHALPARAPQRTAHDECAPTYRPSSRVRDSRAPCSSAAGLSAMPSIGTPSTARRKSRSRPRAHSPTVCVRHASPAESWCDNRPLAVGQIARITQAVAVSSATMFGCPHGALLRESSAQQGITSDSSESRTSRIGFEKF